MNPIRIGNATLYRGDCLEVLKTIADNSVDSIVTDPPYGLTSARKSGRSPVTAGKVMRGFMGLNWDSSVPSVEVWTECLRVLKPGGHLIAFAGTRTHHRMAVNIEDAGFEIRDMIAWINCVLRFVGIERDEDENGNPIGYMDIAVARINHAQKQTKKDSAQMSIFDEA